MCACISTRESGSVDLRSQRTVRRETKIVYEITNLRTIAPPTHSKRDHDKDYDRKQIRSWTCVCMCVSLVATSMTGMKIAPRCRSAGVCRCSPFKIVLVHVFTYFRLFLSILRWFPLNSGFLVLVMVPLSFTGLVCVSLVKSC